jgi:hypothetical protein
MYFLLSPTALQVLLSEHFYPKLRMHLFSTSVLQVPQGELFHPKLRKHLFSATVLQVPHSELFSIQNFVRVFSNCYSFLTVNFSIQNFVHISFSPTVLQIPHNWSSNLLQLTRTNKSSRVSNEKLSNLVYLTLQRLDLGMTGAETARGYRGHCTSFTTIWCRPMSTVPRSEVLTAMVIQSAGNYLQVHTALLPRRLSLTALLSSIREVPGSNLSRRQATITFSWFYSVPEKHSGTISTISSIQSPSATFPLNHSLTTYYSKPCYIRHIKYR